ncbi:MAG: hypothetical protein VX766_17230 [Pseudomonadota bacterium]|nr:hypothetical protein [Pseudomonadota bacterium]
MLSRFALLNDTYSRTKSANEAARQLNAAGHRKSGGKPYTGGDIRQWRLINRGLSQAEHEALLRANAALEECAQCMRTERDALQRASALIQECRL